MKTLTEVQAKAKEMLANEKDTEEIIKYLSTDLQPIDEQLHNAVILVAARWNQNKKNRQEKIITKDQFVMNQNRILSTLHHLINRLEEPVPEDPIPITLTPPIDLKDPTHSLLRAIVILLGLVLITLVVIIFLQLQQ